MLNFLVKTQVHEMKNTTLEMISIHCAGCAAAALPRHLTTELHKIEGGKKLLLYSFVPRH